MKELKLCSDRRECTKAGAVWRSMAEGLPQLDRSPGAIRRNLPPPEGARAASVQSREASSMSPLRDLSPLHSSAPSPGSTDGIHTPASLELVGRLCLLAVRADSLNVAPCASFAFRFERYSGERGRIAEEPIGYTLR